MSEESEVRTHTQEGWAASPLQSGNVESLVVRIVDCTMARLLQSVPEMLTAAQAAALLGIGRSLFLKKHRKGEVPAPTYLGDLPRWPRTELVQWIAAGLPKREDWEKFRRRREQDHETR
jgi:excisionase family DNA binding protein